MLQLNNIEVRYRNVILVLKGVSLEVPDGAVIALLGANGAGKTTTLKAISGMLATEEGRVSKGNILWNGERIENGDPQEITRKGIIQVVEGRRVLEHLTAEENLKVSAHIRGRSLNMNKELERIYGHFPLLKTLRNNISGYLSGGEQQMLVVGRGLIADPKLMLLDEASLGLAPLVVREIYRIIARIHDDEKISMLIVEQNAKFALSIARHGYVMENGRVVLDGTADQLLANEDVREFYLGLSEVGKRKSYKDIKHYRRRKRWLG